MKFGENEVKEYEYYFKTGFFGGGANDVSHMTTLTNRRLVVTWGNAEHSYPISKITAVKSLFNRNIKLMVVGMIVFFMGGAIGDAVGLIMIVFGVVIMCLGWKGNTSLQIGQMGGNEFYTVKGKADKELTELIDVINSKLS